MFYSPKKVLIPTEKKARAWGQRGLRVWQANLHFCVLFYVVLEVVLELDFDVVLRAILDLHFDVKNDAKNHSQNLVLASKS